MNQDVLSPLLVDRWRDAFDLWSAGLRTDNTRRVYRQSWKYFLEYVQKPPGEVTRADVARWVDDMRSKGLSACTRQQRLAAVSCFYTFVNEDFTQRIDGQETPLHDSNPAAGSRFRERINPYGKAIHLGIDQVKKLLETIQCRGTILSKRDYALFLAYVLTGRRNSEIRRLKWGDLEESGGRIWYRWSGKGKHDQRYELPRPVWDAIRVAMNALGRMSSIKPEDYIFTAFDSSSPLSLREVGRLLKMYCKKADLDAQRIHVHTLRHSAAMLRKAAGDDIESICHFLGHSNIGITQIYLHSIEGNKDESWSKASDMLGL
jgi:site-specific recombinase XerD